MTIGKMLLATLVSLAAAVPAHAQDAASYPSKPIKIVVPFPPGGATDLITRKIGEKLTQKWGQPVIVENKPGANTIIGTEAVAKADPDGYTILMTAPSGLVQLPPLYPKLPYDPEKDFLPLTQIAEVATVLIVPSDLPVKSVKELGRVPAHAPGQDEFRELRPCEHAAYLWRGIQARCKGRFDPRAVQRRRARDDRRGRGPRAVHVQQPRVGDDIREAGQGAHARRDR